MKVLGHSLFTKDITEYYGGLATSGGLPGRPVISIEELDDKVMGITGNQDPWVEDARKMAIRRKGDDVYN